MAQKRKYKRYATGGRFKQSGQGLQTSLGRIREQSQITTDALRLQAAQSKEIAGDQIRGLEDVGRSEAENSRTIQDLENKIYSAKYKAIEKRADREVSYILDQAKVKGQEAKFWEKFATKYSQDLYKGAKGLTDLYQFSKAKKMYEDLYASGYSIADFPEVAAFNSLQQQMLDDPNKDWSEADISDSIKSITNKNNHFFWMMLAKDYKDNIDSFETAVKDSSRDVWSRKTANELIVSRTYLFLQEHGIPVKSKAGQEILSLARSRGSSKEVHLQGLFKAGEDEKTVEKLTKVHLATNTRESFETLVKFIKTSNRHTQTSKGWASGNLSWPQAYEKAGKMLAEISGGKENLEKYLSHPIPGSDWGVEWTTDMDVTAKGKPTTEFWDTKHVKITNDILDENDRKLTDLKDRRKKKKGRIAEKQIEDFNLKVDNEEIDVRDFSPGGDVEKLLTEVAQPNVHVDYRDRVYEVLKYDPAKHGEVQPFLDFQRLVTEEPWNVNAITAAYYNIDKKNREIYGPQLKDNLESIKEYADYENRTGFKSNTFFDDITKNANQNVAASGTKVALNNASGSRQASKHMDLHFRSVLMSLPRTDKNKNVIPIAQRIEDAKAIVLKEVERGNNGGGGIYSREAATQGKPSAVWTNFVPEPASDASQLADAEIIDNTTLIYNIAYDPSFTRKNLTKYLTENKIVTDTQFKELTEMAITGDFDRYNIPVNVKRLSALTLIPENKIISAILRSRAENIKEDTKTPHWPTGSTDITFSSISDKIDFYPKNPTESFNINLAYQENINNGYWPMSPTLKSYKDKSLNIDFSDTSKTFKYDDAEIRRDMFLEGVYYNPYDNTFVDRRVKDFNDAILEKAENPIDLQEPIPREAQNYKRFGGIINK